MRPPDRPVILEGDALEGAAADPAAAPPPPEPGPRGAAMATPVKGGARRGGGAGRLALGLAGALIALAAGVSAWDFVLAMAARNAVLGAVAVGLGGALAVLLVVVLLAELRALLRLRRIGRLQARAADPLARQDRTRAVSVARSLADLYAARAELALAAEDLDRRLPGILDADAVLAAAETAFLSPLDAEARREVEGAARSVAAATALVPLALADVAVALAANLRMIRRIAQVYGGRGGALGSLRLLRAVASHLVATGAVAVGDDLIGSVLGGGALARVSRRFGEGVVNGALTARVGVAAMEVCRPLPFAACPRPRSGRLVQRALSGLFATRG